VPSKVLKEKCQEKGDKRAALMTAERRGVATGLGKFSSKESWTNARGQDQKTDHRVGNSSIAKRAGGKKKSEMFTNSIEHDRRQTTRRLATTPRKEKILGKAERSRRKTPGKKGRPNSRSGQHDRIRPPRKKGYAWETEDASLSNKKKREAGRNVGKPQRENQKFSRAKITRGRRTGSEISYNGTPRSRVACCILRRGRKRVGIPASTLDEEHWKKK